MKLSLRTLKGEFIYVQVQPTTTIAEVKGKVKELKGIQVETQKIVYKGKQIQDANNVGQLGIKEGDIIVLMNLIKKAQVKQKQETVLKKQQIKPVPKPAEVKQQSVPNTNEAKLTQLMSMGFQRQKCVAALNAAFNNTDVAVDYLINGIPAGLNGPQQQAPQNVQQVLRALMSTPQFAPIRQVLRDDPTSLNTVLEQIMSISPPLYNMIAENPQTFQKILLQQDFQQQQNEQEDIDDYGQQPQAGEQSIHITHQQQAAIKRLMALGFIKIDAAQAYFACDKNQQMAANLLFDRMANGDLDPNFGFGNGGNQDPDEDDDNLFN